jgi:ADP-ribose pyrophosphatase YjhB (NUDIX family)
MADRPSYGRPRPVCPACGYIHFDDPKVAAAVVVEQEGKILLVRRAYNPEQGSGPCPPAATRRWSGRRRCALQETGRRRILGLMDVIYGREHPRGASIVIVYRGEVDGGSLAAGDDAGEVALFAPSALPPLAFRATKQVVEHWAAGSML